MKLIPFTEDPLGNLGMFLLPAASLGAVLSGTTAAAMGLRLNQAVRNYLSELARWSPALGTVARGFRSGAVGRFTTKSGVVTDQQEGEGGRGSDGCRRRVRRERRG